MWPADPLLALRLFLALAVVRATPLIPRDNPGHLGLSIDDSNHYSATALYRSSGNYTCDACTVYFSGSNPPFQLSAVLAASENVTVADLGSYSTSGATMWAVAVPAGQEVRLKVADAAANTIYSNPLAVQEGNSHAETCHGPSNEVHYAMVVMLSIFGGGFGAVLAAFAGTAICLYIRRWWLLRTRPAVPEPAERPASPPVAPARAAPAAPARLTFARLALPRPAPDPQVELHQLGVVEPPMPAYTEVDLGRPREEDLPPGYEARKN